MATSPTISARSSDYEGPEWQPRVMQRETKDAQRLLDESALTKTSPYQETAAMTDRQRQKTPPVFNVESVQCSKRYKLLKEAGRDHGNKNKQLLSNALYDAIRLVAEQFKQTGSNNNTASDIKQYHEHAAQMALTILQ